MHFRRSILVLLIVVVSLFSLSGCAGMMRYVLTPTPTPTIAPTPEPTPVPTPVPTPSPTPAPDINAFRGGFGDQSGYFSRYFDFGFNIPDGWYNYNRSDIDQLNTIQTLSTDRESYFQEYITRLKKGEVLYDYVAYRDKANELILVYMKDYWEHAKIKDNLLRWKERNKGPEIGGRKWDRSGRNTTKTSGRMRSSYRVQAQRL